MCVCVRVCVRERERERTSDLRPSSPDKKHFIVFLRTLGSQQQAQEHFSSLFL